MPKMISIEFMPAVGVQHQSPAPVLAWRLVLVGSVAFVAAVAWWLASQGAPAQGEPELTLLLRGMAVIKGCLAGLALALVLWRLRLPIAGTVALAYAACVCLLFATSILVWFQVSVPGAAVLFHAGELALLLVAWREGFPMPRLGRQERDRSMQRVSSDPLRQAAPAAPAER